MNLTLSAQTLRNVCFEERVRLAAAAGFTGIGLSVRNYLDARRDGLDDPAMLEIVSEHGVVVSEVEFLNDWAPSSLVEEPEQQEFIETIAHMARTFRALNVNAGLFRKLPIAVLRESLAILCGRLWDLRIAVEFMPFGPMPDLATAWQVIQEGGDNSGLLIDTWHWIRSRVDPADLDQIPPDRVFGIQLCDVGEHPMSEQRYESLHHRVVPGKGFGGLPTLARMLVNHAPQALISAEVMSDELAEVGAETTAIRVYQGTINVLSATVAPETTGSPSDATP